MLYRNQEIKDRNIDEFLGLAKGIMADGKVNEDEIRFMYNWMQKHFNDEELSHYPLSVIFDRVTKALEDDILDKEELSDISTLLTKFTGGEPISQQVKSMSSTLPLCSPEPNIVFDGHSFCFTGTFTIGTRKACQNLIEELGGTFHKTPTLKTNYLVIGILGNEDWIHSSYGRKIEQAVSNRDTKETGIHIISEETFIRYL